MKVTDELIQQRHCVISLSVHRTCAVFLQGFLKETAKTSERTVQCGRNCLIMAETLISHRPKKENEDNLGYIS